MSWYQIFVIGLSVCLNALDGFDVLAITFAAPGISHDWAISLAGLGVVISSGLIGMVAGSIFIAPLADRFGRRPIVLASLVLMSGGMLLTSTSSSIPVLCGWRILTGLGIGGMIAAINAVASEFSSERRRDLSVSIMTIGYPIGGLVGGLASAVLVEKFGWPSIFVAGGLATLAFLPIVWFSLPESIDFLNTRTDQGSAARINLTLGRMGHPPARQAQGLGPSPLGMSSLFGPQYRTLTILLVGAYFLHIMTFYFYSGWLPKIMTDGGFAVSASIATSAIMNIGGIIGGLLLGWAAPVLGLKRLTVGAMCGTTVMMALFGLAPANLAVLRIIAFLLGFFMFGGIVGLYAFLARAFPAGLRVTGSGLAIACGRGGAVVGPILGGVLLQEGLRPGAALVVIGFAAALGALFLGRIRLGEPKRVGAGLALGAKSPT
ncbi:MAG: MFS transporter [Janthinobacterium lividum]